MFVVMTSAVILSAGLLPMIVLAPGPEAKRIAKKAQALHDPRQAGVKVDGDDLAVAGWKPEHGMTAIWTKLDGELRQTP
jgi:hypothetical protein